MKRTLLITMLVLTLLLPKGLADPLGLAHAQTSGGYELTWWTVDNGGGASTGGVYSLIGTIGQADAESLGGGEYTLDGGFWSGINLVTVNYQVFLPMILR